MQQLANVGNVNEPIAKRPLGSAHRRPDRVAGRGSVYLANWPGTAVVGTVPTLFETPGRAWTAAPGWMPAKSWPVGPNALLAENDSILFRHEPLPFFSMRTRRMAPVAQHGTSVALYDERHSRLVPYLALVWSLLDRNEVEAARTVLDAVPLDVSDERQTRRLKRLLAPPRVAVSATRDVDRTAEYRWLRDHGHDCRGQWVALGGDRVVAAASSLKELQESLRALNLATVPLVHRLD